MATENTTPDCDNCDGHKAVCIGLHDGDAYRQYGCDLCCSHVRDEMGDCVRLDSGRDVTIERMQRERREGYWAAACRETVRLIAQGPCTGALSDPPEPCVCPSCHCRAVIAACEAQ